MRGISVLGSTGSIGTQTLDVIRRNKDIKVVALAAGTRVKELADHLWYVLELKSLRAS